MQEWRVVTLNKRNLTEPKSRAWFTFNTASNPKHKQVFLKITSHQDSPLLTISGTNEDGRPNISQAFPKEVRIVKAMAAKDWAVVIRWVIDNKQDALLSML